MDKNEFLMLDKKVTRLLDLFEIIMPAHFEIGQIASMAGVQKQTIYKYLTRNYIDERDFFKNGGKIIVSREIALELISKYQTKKGKK